MREKMMSDLKPCGRCGSNDIGFRDSREKREVFCRNCYNHIGFRGLDSEGAILWNSRPIEDKLRAENEALKDALYKMTNNAEWLKSTDDIHNAPEFMWHELNVDLEAAKKLLEGGD
jgi:hypothetical protein